MTLRQMRKAVSEGTWVLEPVEEIPAPTPFQQRRLNEAVNLARLYLNKGLKVGDLGRVMGVTPERVAQMVRLGISVMRQLGCLRPSADETTSS